MVAPPSKIEWPSNGHQSLVRSVKTRNACSTGQSTVTDLRSASSFVIRPILGPSFAFRRRLEGRERLVPESVEVRPQLGQALAVHAVEVACALTPLPHQAGPLEHAEVLGDRRP